MDLKQALPVLESALYEAWGQIGYDVLDCAQSCGDSVDNFEAIEACLDADRLLLVCNNVAAHKLCKDLIKEHGYQTVLKFLANHVNLH